MYYLLLRILSLVVLTGLMPAMNANALENLLIDNLGKVSYDLQIAAGDKVTGGMLCGTVTNDGEINNLAICAQGRVSGGQVTGTVNNQGTLCDTEIMPGASVVGGTLCGLIINQGIITDVTLKADTAIKGGILQGSIQGDATQPAYLGAVSVAAGSQLCGVKLSPTVQLGDNVTLCDNVIVPAEPDHPALRDFNMDPEKLGQLDAKRLPRLEEVAFGLLLSKHVTSLSPELFAAFNLKHLNALSWKGVRGITIAQFQQLPYDKLAGFSKDNLGALSPDIVKQLNLAQLMQLKPVILQLSEQDVAMFLTCLSPNIPISEIVDLVPKNWQLNAATGELLPPVDAKLFFRKMDNVSKVPSQVNLEYDLPDLNTNLSIAGSAPGDTLLQHIQQALNLAGLGDYHVAQQSDGIVVVTHGSLTFTLIPNLATIQQVADSVPVGVSVDNQGNYRVVTPNHTMVTLIAVPKKFNDLATLFGETSRAKCNKSGDVLLQVPTHYLRRGRSDEEVNVVSTFDPFVEPASEDVCQDGVCNWDAVDEASQPGLVVSDDTRAQQISKIIYMDGTSQRIYPTVLQPDVFMDEARKIAGVEDISFNRDGTFTVMYQATQFHLYPSFKTEVTTVVAGQVFAAQLTLNADNTVSYSVQDEESIFTFRLAIGS